MQGFSYDSFERTPELIAAGEATMRAALPRLRALLKPPISTTPKKGGAPAGRNLRGGDAKQSGGLEPPPISVPARANRDRLMQQNQV